MAENVDQWRAHAKAAIHRTSIPYAGLVQALPNLSILARNYRTASFGYAAVHGMGQDIAVLERVETLAQKRYHLMWSRALVAQDSIRVVRGLRRDNSAIFAFQVAIMAGKIAELYIGLSKWAGVAKTTIDGAKATIDGFKVGSGLINGIRQADTSGAGLSLLQATALVIRVRTSWENTAKIIWDAASTERRRESAREWTQTLSAVLNGLKGLVDQLAALFTYFGSTAHAGEIKYMGAQLGAARDVIDAGRAFVNAIRALQEVVKTFEAEEMLHREVAGYLGVAEVLQLRPPVPLHSLNPTEIVEGARSMTDAKALLDAVRAETARLTRSMGALGHEVTTYAIRLETALHAAQRLMDDADSGLEDMSRLTKELEPFLQRGGPNSEDIRKIYGNLVGFRQAVLSLEQQIQSIAVQSRAGPSEHMEPPRVG